MYMLLVLPMELIISSMAEQLKQCSALTRHCRSIVITLKLWWHEEHCESFCCIQYRLCGIATPYIDTLLY